MNGWMDGCTNRQTKKTDLKSTPFGNSPIVLASSSVGYPYPFSNCVSALFNFSCVSVAALNRWTNEWMNG